MLKNAIWLFVFALFVFFYFLPSYNNVQDLRQKNFDYERQIQELKIKNTQLTHEKRLLEDDPVYLEKVGREKMGLLKEGEVVYRMPPVVNAVGVKK